MTDRVSQISESLRDFNAEAVEESLASVKAMPDLTNEEKIDLARLLSEVFYHAHHTGATEVPKLAVRTEKRLSKFGPVLIPFLLDELTEADGESAVYFGKTLARMGTPALDTLIEALDDGLDSNGTVINMLQGLSYFKTPDVLRAVPLMVEAATSNNHQVTAMALFSLARLIQKLPSSAFREDLTSALFENAFTFLAHPQGLVRRNSARLLGRMLRKGLLSEEQERRVNISFLAVTGRDEKHNWDRSFIVRREAESYLKHFHKPAASTPRYAQSFRILQKRLLCSGTYHFVIEAPLVARKIEAGQFVIVRPHLLAERIPLSVCDWNRAQGTLSLIVATAGKTTAEITALQEGQSFKDVVGPLGERSRIPAAQGTCVVVGGGYGTGAIIPVARALRASGHKVIGIAGARNREAVIMTESLKESCDEVMITTNDGSAGLGGMVTDALRELLHREEVIYVLAIGPVPMMKAVSDLTKARGISTYVSLNAIMVDGTGMCGACRVSVGGQTKFACFHGPEFDGHLVDFDNLAKRQKMFAQQEQVALSRIRK